MKRLLICAVALPLLLAADKDKADPKKELAKFDGTWTVASSEFDGKSLDEKTKDLRLAFKDGIMTVKGDEEVEKGYGKMTIKLDPSTTPKIIDLTVTAGDEKDSVLEGIYEWKGDELKLCLNFASGIANRPLEFETKAGSNRVLLVLKRENP